jgi:hypothetical protein
MNTAQVVNGGRCADYDQVRARLLPAIVRQTRPNTVQSSWPTAGDAWWDSDDAARLSLLAAEELGLLNDLAGWEG